VSASCRDAFHFDNRFPGVRDPQEQEVTKGDIETPVSKWQE
jgi:hypothetical protein